MRLSPNVSPASRWRNISKKYSDINKHTQKPKKDYACLELDEQTLLDLEIFESTSQKTLFKFCDFTNNKGALRALKCRMESPPAQAEQIRNVQLSLRFIIDHREVFKVLPNSHIISRVERYLSFPLPIVAAKNSFEFGMGALSMWANNFNHYFNIWKGVAMMCTLIHNLREFVGQPTLKYATGELAELVNEMHSLVNDEKLPKISKKEYGIELWEVWKVLRFDQAFRINETDLLSRLLSLLYEIEALISMAECTKKHNFVFPEIMDGPLCIEGEGLVHPYVVEPVSNPVRINQEHRGLFLTGPNMAGKTTYLRAFATALFFAHLGMGVPAKRFRFTPVEKLISSITLSDSLHEGVSYFRAEALRIKDIAKALVRGDRVVAIMDEPFKGTNVKDTLEASLSMLERFSRRENFLFMFSSHQIELANKLTGPIDCRCFTAIETEMRLRFDYLLREGVAKQRIGMRVLEEEGVFKLLDES